jgi:hypothetical protein
MESHFSAATGRIGPPSPEAPLDARCPSLLATMAMYHVGEFRNCRIKGTCGQFFNWVFVSMGKIHTYVCSTYSFCLSPFLKKLTSGDD